jgi:hypothetical protein
MKSSVRNLYQVVVFVLVKVGQRMSSKNPESRLRNIQRINAGYRSGQLEFGTASNQFFVSEKRMDWSR